MHKDVRRASSRNKERERAESRKQSNLQPLFKISPFFSSNTGITTQHQMASSPCRLRPSPPEPPEAQGKNNIDTLGPRFLESTPTVRKARNALLSFDELPNWLQDNEFILQGYRRVSGSAHVSFRSWSYIHNESVNIYSHLVPAIIFLLGELYICQHLKRKYSNLTVADFLIFSFFLLTAFVCLGLSTTYHTMMNHSSKVEQLLLRFDLTGIVILTLGDFVSGIYMVFWCDPLQRKIYWSMVSQSVYLFFFPSHLLFNSYFGWQIGTLGSLTVFIMLIPNFHGRKFRLFRTLAFVGTGLSGFAPLIHGVKMFGLSQMMKQSGMPYYLVEGGFLLLGAFIYVVRLWISHMMEIDT